MTVTLSVCLGAAADRSHDCSPFQQFPILGFTMPSTLCRPLLAALLTMAVCLRPADALDYAYATAEPQKTGWPLSAEEEAYVLKPEYERRPGAEITQHKPELWPVVPAAGCWGGRTWLDTHANLVKVAERPTI